MFQSVRFKNVFDTVEFKFLITKNLLEILRLENGNNFENLWLKFYVEVLSDDKDTWEKVIKLKSEKIEEISKAIELICHQLFVALDNQSDGLHWLLDESQNDFLTSHDINKLNDILESTSAMIDIFPINCPKSSEKVIRVRGSPFQISNCLFHFFHFLSNCPVKVTPWPYLTTNSDSNLAEDYGGFSVIEEESKEEKEKREKIKKQKLYFDELSSNYPLSFKNRVDTGDVLTTEHFDIPLNLIEVLLGDKGERIEQMAKESNTEIFFILFEDDFENFFLKVTGLKAEINNLKKLIMFCIENLCIKKENNK